MAVMSSHASVGKSWAVASAMFLTNRRWPLQKGFSGCAFLMLEGTYYMADDDYAPGSSVFVEALAFEEAQWH